MQKWLDDNDILIYSTHNEDKSVVNERFIKTIKKGKIYKKLAAYYSKSFLSYWNKLIDQCNNT